jgi:hypothetical protein
MSTTVIGDLTISGYISKTAIRGQFDVLQTLTPVDAGTVTIDYALSNMFVMEMS